MLHWPCMPIGPVRSVVPHRLGRRGRAGWAPQCAEPGAAQRCRLFEVISGDRLEALYVLALMTGLHSQCATSRSTRNGRTSARR
jgi:hypothetical protein